MVDVKVESATKRVTLCFFWRFDLYRLHRLTFTQEDCIFYDFMLDAGRVRTVEDLNLTLYYKRKFTELNAK